jgi:hypothetical protein
MLTVCERSIGLMSQGGLRLWALSCVRTQALGGRKPTIFSHGHQNPRPDFAGYSFTALQHPVPLD